ncbi:hypothetical protein HZQ89_18235 [Elizabethkingia anophelis]|nr:hypothetical protein [Elizabethkingia anophelis]
MDLPVANIVSEIDLKPTDVLLPLYEVVANSIISLIQTRDIDRKDKRIQIQIYRGGACTNPELFRNSATISSIKVIDNGEGFTDLNYQSYKTAYSTKNKKDFGCKGIGRFTVLATFERILIKSNYLENKEWKYREFLFDSINEVQLVNSIDSEISERKTIVELSNWNSDELRDFTALDLEEIAEQLMQHCLIYYLCGDLPNIEIYEPDRDKSINLNKLYDSLSKDAEKDFTIAKNKFSCFVTRKKKNNSRKNHYVHYCANSRIVGSPKSLSNVDAIFAYPINENNNQYLLDIYVVSEYLNKKVYPTRNGFSISQEKSINNLFNGYNPISFDEIEYEVAKCLYGEYESYVIENKEKSRKELIDYINNQSPQFKRYVNRPEVLNKIPPNISDDKKEEHLYRIAYNERKEIDNQIQNFISSRNINENTVQKIKEELKEKAIYDSDNLADYMFRRKAVIDVFNKFLDADENGDYKLENDIHNLIFPTGLTNEDVDYESHNLWLLDERFATYKFVASDKSITSFSQKRSSKEPDITMMNELDMFNHHFSFAPKSAGELDSLVIFEFKRPGDTAWQKKKTDFKWEFSELLMKYFDDFIYSPDKKNYKGNHVTISKSTPKYGYLIMDVIPNQLADFNLDKGFGKTPFGTYYKLYDKLNLHIEVLTFRTLIESVEKRHTPFFDKLFTR